MTVYRHRAIICAIACLLHYGAGAHGATIQVDNHGEFVAIGWTGPYEAAEDATVFPVPMGEDVRALEGHGFWYFYADGDPAEVELSWTVPEEMLNSPWSTLQLRYYTTGTVTMEPVEDTYVEVVQPTEGSIWGQHLANIEWYGGDKIIIKIMPGPQGYLIFDQMIIEYDGPLPPTPTSGPDPTPTDGQGTEMPTTTSAGGSTSSETEAPTSFPSTPAQTPSTDSPTFSTEPPMTTTFGTSTPWPTTSGEDPSTTHVPTTPDEGITTTTTTAAPTTTPAYPPAPGQPGDPCHPLFAPCDPLVVPNTECRIVEPPTLHRCVCVQMTDLSSDGRRCLAKARRVGDGCDSDLQCTPLTGTWCHANAHGYKYCTYSPSASELFCLPFVERLGLPCIESVQCITEGAHCSENTCSCRANGGMEPVPSRDGLRCLPVVAWQQPCEEAEQCMPTLGQFGTCERSSPGGAGVCGCRAPTQIMGSACYHPVPLHQPCAQNEECALGSNSTLATCASSKRCACIPGTLEWAGKCYADLSIGDACENDEQCNVPIAGEVYCDLAEGVCLCKGPGAVGANGEKICGLANGSGKLYAGSFVFVQFSAACLSLVFTLSIKL